MRCDTKIALHLLGFKGYSCLKAIIDAGLDHKLSLTVVIGTDVSVTNDYSEEIKSLCTSEKIKTFSRSEIIPFKSYQYIFAVGWRWLIKEVAEEKLIVFHDSLLPKYRGFAPLVNAALNREKQVGVTVLFGASEYDKGKIIAQKTLDITYPIRINKLIELIAPCYAFLIVKILSCLSEGETLIGKEQSESEATYSVWLDVADYFLDWESSSNELASKVNLLGEPYQSAQSYMMNTVVNIHSAEVYKDLSLERRHVGKVLIVEDGCPVIICGRGLLKITRMTDKKNNNLIPFKSLRVRFK